MLNTPLKKLSTLILNTFELFQSAQSLNGIQYLNTSNLKGSSRLKAVNWWKVLGCDCIGGMVAGPGGYAGASAISVIMQL